MSNALMLLAIEIFALVYGASFGLLLATAQRDIGFNPFAWVMFGGPVALAIALAVYAPFLIYRS